MLTAEQLRERQASASGAAVHIEDPGSDMRWVNVTDRAGNTKALPAIERDDLEDRDRGADLGRRVRKLFIM